MKTKMKKYLSVFLAVVFALTMIPLSSLIANAATTITLEDGTEWLTDSGNLLTLQSDGTGGYKLDATKYDTPDSAYKLMQNKAYPVLTTTFNLGAFVGQNTNSGRATFGLSANYSLDNVGTGVSSLGRFEIINHYKNDGQRRYQYLYMVINGVQIEVGKIQVSMQATYGDISVVKENGSFYMTYLGTTINGEGYSDEVKQAVKLENYFPAEFLENNGMLYFFFSGEALRWNKNYYKPTTVVGDSAIYMPIDVIKRDFSKYYDEVITSYGVAPTATWLSKHELYHIEFNKGDGSVALGRPITAYADGSYPSFTIGDAKYTDGTKEVSILTEDSKVYIDFSNDPYFTENSYNSVSLTRSANDTSKTMLGTNDPDFNGVYFPAYNLVNQLAGSAYNYGFTVNDSNQVVLSIKLSSYGGDVKALPKLTAGKPIYIRLRKAADNYTLNLNIKPYDTNDTEINNIDTYITAANDLDNPLDAKQAVADYLASSCRTAVTYSKQLTASNVMYKYYNAVKSAAEDIMARINAIPSADKLVYADAEKLNAIKADYDAAGAEVQAKVTNIEKLTNAIAKLPTEDDGRVRTEDGTIWNVDYDSAYATVSSKESGALSFVSTEAGKNKEDSAIYAITEDTYPILNGTYDVVLNNGVGYSAFGFTAYDNMESVYDVPYNNFTIVRDNVEPNTTYYVMINGEMHACGTRGNSTRARKLSISVVKDKENGYHYLQVGDGVLNGADYDATVQEALKLENHFGADFLENNSMIHFFVRCDSLGGAPSYARATTRLLDGTIGYAADTFKDLNTGALDTNITAYNSNASETTYSNGTTTYKFTVAKNGYAILTAPINKSGFSVKGYMAPDPSAHQWYALAFSNDPTFSDGTELKLSAVQITNKTDVHYIPAGASGATVTNKPGLFNGVAQTFSIEDKDANGTHTVYIGGSDSKLDVTSLINKPIYLKVVGVENGTADMVIENYDLSANKNAEIAAAFPSESATADEILAGLEAFYASEYRYSSYANNAKATELALLANQKLAQDVIDEIAEISENTDYFVQKDRILTLANTVSELDVAVRGGIVNYKTYASFTHYINNLSEINEDSFADLRKLLLGLDATGNKNSYDYNNNGEADICDLVRADNYL